MYDDVVASGLSVAGHVNVGLGISATTESYFASDVNVDGNFLVKGSGNDYCCK